MSGENWRDFLLSLPLVYSAGGIFHLKLGTNITLVWDEKPERGCEREAFQPQNNNSID